MPGALTFLTTIQVGVCQWLSEYQRSEVQNTERPSADPGVVVLDVYVAHVERGGDWDLSTFTGDPHLRHHDSISVDYDHLREVCSIDILSFHTFVVDLFRTAVQTVLVLSDSCCWYAGWYA